MCGLFGCSGDYGERTLDLAIIWAPSGATNRATQPFFLCVLFACRYETHSGYAFEGSWLDRIGLLHSKTAVSFLSFPSFLFLLELCVACRLFTQIYHDFHHTKNRGNYSGPANGLLDVLFGTEDYFLRATSRGTDGSAKNKWLKTHLACGSAWFKSNIDSFNI